VFEDSGALAPGILRIGLSVRRRHEIDMVDNHYKTSISVKYLISMCILSPKLVPSMLDCMGGIGGFDGIELSVEEAAMISLLNGHGTSVESGWHWMLNQIQSTVSSGNN
jgi:hypothetical protein